MKSIIAANWKMNMTLPEIEEYFNEMKLYENRIDFSKKEVLIAPPSLYLLHIKSLLNSFKSKIKIGLQNCHFENNGAFTGEISPLMAQDTGADFIIAGHSERRHIFKESNELINKKVIACTEKNILTILCIGEKLEQREANLTFEIIENQLSEGLEGVNKFENLLIAYEPVWAIGTGRTATPEQISEVHAWLRKFLEKNIANNIPLLYGGSVKPDNIKRIMSIENVDGVLVGGASLNAGKFIKIINFE